MIRTATAGVFLSLAAVTSAAAWQQRARIAVAVISAEYSDSSLKAAAGRLTAALRATSGLTEHFELYDTSLTRKSTLGTSGQRLAPRLPTRYVCLSRVSPAIPGWAQATISFVDASVKDPVVRLSSPVLLRSDSAFHSFARLAWERLAKVERQRTGRADGGAPVAPGRPAR